MKNKNYKNTFLISFISWSILTIISMLVFEKPLSFALTLKMFIGAMMIGMAYYFVVTREEDV